MGLTTWAGHLRVDWRPDAGRVRLTLLTVEPTTEAELRSGLLVGFVTADAHGPPALVEVAVPEGRLPADVATLLGARVADAVADTTSFGGAGTWTRLDLDEVYDLASSWGPYRAHVLRPVAGPTPVIAGRWADGLWTCLGLPDVLGGGPRPVFRGSGEPRDPDAPRGSWRLPGDLAGAVGCEPVVGWTLIGRERDSEGDTVTLDVVAVRAGTAAGTSAGVGRLLVGFDDGTGRWVPAEPGPGDTLTARVSGPMATSNIRFRAEPRGSGL